MDLALDQIRETTESAEKDSNVSATGQQGEQSTLNADLQDAYRAISSTTWGASIGGFFGTVMKHGESVYREAQQELTAVGQDATKGFSDLRDTIISRTRAISLSTSTAATREGDLESVASDSKTAVGEEADNVLSRIKVEAAKRLKDLQKAEDAADEALLKFGTNLRDFLRDAVSISAPTAGSGGPQSAVLFESKDAQGKRVIHTSRFDAQLHVIHTTTDNFVKDASGTEFDAWTKSFDIDSKTKDIADDLSKYPELRDTMEKLVPDQIPYADFWRRYYFLRHGIETAEARRRDLLKAASAEEEVGWDEDDSDDEAGSGKLTGKTERPGSTGSSTTIQPPAVQSSLKPAESRKSNDEKSQADSEASYDVVGAASGVPSQAPSSPKDSRKGDDSDEEDWE